MKLITDEVEFTVGHTYARVAGSTNTAAMRALVKEGEE